MALKIQPGGNLPRVKLSNQVAIRKMIYHYGPITRAEISRQLNLTLPTITTNVSAMLAEGILREVAPVASDEKAIGRPANPVDIAADCAYFIGVEMRGTRRQLCVTDMRGHIFYEDASEVPCVDYSTALHSASKMICDAISSGAVPPEKIARIGFCTPGLMDSKDGLLVIHPGYNWVNKPLRQDLACLTDFHRPIIIENNARARANGALMFHPETTQDCNSFAYMFISTGIACPFILNNGLMNAIALGAGEVGHMVLDPLGPKCRCGNRGCLESVSSDAAILHACEAAIAAGNAPILAELCGEDALTMELVLQAQKAGESSVCNVLQRALYYIGLAIANIYNFIQPNVLLIEGKLFTNLNNRQTMLDIVNDNLYSTTIGNANFVFVEPDDRSGALGAAATAIRDYLEDTFL